MAKPCFARLSLTAKEATDYGFPPSKMATPKKLVAAAAVLLDIAFLVILYRGVMALKPPESTFLSDLQPISVAQDWGRVGLDRSVDGNRLRIGRARYPKGLGTHANSRICYALRGRYRHFAAGAGADLEAASSDRKIAFRVLGDGRVLYDSPVVSGLREPLRVQLDVGGVQELCLLVLDGGDGITGDHADWGGARVAP